MNAYVEEKSAAGGRERLKLDGHAVSGLGGRMNVGGGTMSFTRRHYRKVADLLNSSGVDDTVVWGFCGMFQEDNSRFDCERSWHAIRASRPAKEAMA
jgi:hypothetical protein